MSVSNGWQSDVIPCDDRLLKSQRIIEDDLLDAIDRVRYDSTRAYDVFVLMDKIWAQFHPDSPSVRPDWEQVQLPDTEDIELIREAIENEDVAEVYCLVANIALAIGLIG